MDSETKPGDYLSGLTFEQLGQCVKNMVAMLPGILEKDADHIGRCVCVASGVATKPKKSETRPEEINGAFPMQPLVRDSSSVVRFQQNHIVRFLLDTFTGGMNALLAHHFGDEDRQQLAQLIGYSVDGYNDLSYVSYRAALRSDAQLQQFLEREKQSKPISG